MEQQNGANQLQYISDFYGAVNLFQLKIRFKRAKIKTNSK